MALVIVLLTIVGTLSLWLVAPEFSRQVTELLQRLPEALDHLRSRLQRYRFTRMVLNELPASSQLIENLPLLLAHARGLVFTTVSVLIQAIVVVFLGLYIAAEPRLYREGVLHLVPIHRRTRAREILQTIAYTLRWWLIGQAITMVVIGTVTGLGLWLIGIPLALMLGVLAGLFNFIPNFGPLISLIPAMLLALTISPAKAFWVLMLYIVAQSFEGYLLTPMVQRRAILLPPALTISVQVLMGWLVGALGVMFAAPLTAVLMVFVKMAYVEDKLRDRIGVPGEQQARDKVSRTQPRHERPESNEPPPT